MDKHTAVREHLRKEGSITSMEAIGLYGATRLSGIIFNLRKEGMDIETVRETGKDRYGHATRFARYFLRE